MKSNNFINIISKNIREKKKYSLSSLPEKWIDINEKEAFHLPHRSPV
jgi:hypothetical protein